jgi:hypothetical protein
MKWKTSNLWSCLRLLERKEKPYSEIGWAASRVLVTDVRSGGKSENWTLEAQGHVICCSFLP